MVVAKALLVGALLAIAPPRVSVSVTPVIVFAGKGIIVACRVPRNAANRGLDIVLVPVQSSYRQLDGMESLITHQLAFGRVPCDATGVACVLHAQGEDDQIAKLPLLVVGCDE